MTDTLVDLLLSLLLVAGAAFALLGSWALAAPTGALRQPYALREAARARRRTARACTTRCG
jgi:hypothetical protein